VTDRAAPYVLAAGETRRDDAILPFKALASDTGGLLSVCEFTLGAWKSGPVLRMHTGVDEAFYVVAGKLEAQLDDRRVQAGAGGFLWVPRGTAHSFASAGPEPVQVLALALPGGVEELFAEQAAYLSSVQGRPMPACWPRSAPVTARPRSGRRSGPRTPRAMVRVRYRAVHQRPDRHHAACCPVLSQKRGRVLRWATATTTRTTRSTSQ
jgi:mannose-6-phosphate isomerase-like protein (cupin superfamily)